MANRRKYRRKPRLNSSIAGYGLAWWDGSKFLLIYKFFAIADRRRWLMRNDPVHIYLCCKLSTYCFSFDIVRRVCDKRKKYSVYQNYCDSSLKDHGHYNFKARQLIFNGLVAYPFLPMLLKNGLDWPSFDQVTSVLVQVVQFWLCPYVVKLRPKKGVFCQFWPFLRENKWCP